MKDQYERLKAAGCCNQCGGKSETGTTRCNACKAKRSGKVAEWKAKGLCGQCGRKRTPNKKQCQRCIDKSQVYRDRNREHVRKLAREHYYRCKQQAFEAYGGAKCNCCDEDEETFLTFDHIDGGGAEHRKRRTDLVRWLQEHNFPPGFQVLCMNCNWGKYANGGVCPHQT